MGTRRDYAIEVDRVGRGADQPAVERDLPLHPLADKAVAVNVEPGLVSRRLLEGFARSISIYAGHGYGGTTRKKAEREEKDGGSCKWDGHR